MNRIATVIAAHDAEPFIGATLRSVAASGTDRIIVALDRCTDGTERAVEQAGVDALLTRSPRPGVSSARNHGAALAADCTYLHFVDADDLVRPGAAKILSYALEINHQAVAAYGNIDRIDASGRPYGVVRPPDDLAAPSGDLLRALLTGNLISCPSSLLMRRAAFEEVGGFAPHLTHAEDWHLWTRVAALGPFLHVRRITADYRTHRASASFGIGMSAAPYLASVAAVFSDPTIRRKFPEQELRLLRREAIASIYYYLAEQEARKGSSARAGVWLLRSLLKAPGGASARHRRWRQTRRVVTADASVLDPYRGDGR